MVARKERAEGENGPLTEWERRELAYYERCSPRELDSFGMEALTQYRALMLKYLAGAACRECGLLPRREAARSTRLESSPDESEILRAVC